MEISHDQDTAHDARPLPLGGKCYQGITLRWHFFIYMKIFIPSESIIDSQEYKKQKIPLSHLT